MKHIPIVLKIVLAIVFAVVLMCPALTIAADFKPVSSQTSNTNLEIHATMLIAPPDMRHALDGEDMQHGFLIVKVTTTSKSGAPVRVGPDDFTLLSRKDGERSPAQTPRQVVGGASVLVLKPAAEQPGGDGTATGGPVWSGVSIRKRPVIDGDGAPAAKIGDPRDNSFVTLLTQKALPDQDVKTSSEGLLYFGYDGKLKPKDLALMYDGQAGKLVVDFK